MSDIKRYDIFYDCNAGAVGGLNYDTREQGVWVKHADHLAALKQARIDAVREFSNAVWDSGELTGRDGEFLIGFAHQHIKELSNDG